MTSIASFLPKPKHSAPPPVAKSSTPVAPTSNSHHASSSVAVVGPPPYGHRQNWVPRTLSDFGEGGAFPEIHLAQYPKDMGRKKSSAAGSKTLAIRVNEAGEIQYDALARYGHASNQIVHSTLKDLIPMDIAEGDTSMERPSDDVVQQTAERTKNALMKIVNDKTTALKATAMKVTMPGAPQYVRYTPDDYGSSGQTKIIRIAETPVDPLEPPRFKHKKVPRGPTSPPAPVMHSPPRKITVEEQREWYIPPCISNWKNANGYTIPLDKRLAADGRGLQEVTINDNFAKFAEALYIADRHAREEVEKRAQMQQKLAQKEKEAKEMHLRMLAQKAREERSGFAAAAAPLSADVPSERGGHESPASRDYEPSRRRSLASEEDEERDEGYRERERLRRENQREIQRKVRMTHMGSETRAKVMAREMDRDVSERIALGGAAPSATRESIYDQRLFNQSRGISAGFKDDEAYDLYDKPLFQATASSIYRPRNVDVDAGANADAEIDRLKSESRFVPDRGFQGADAAGSRDGPVQFEKAADPFGIDAFLEEATRGSGKRTEPSTHGAREQEAEQGKRRRHE